MFTRPSRAAIARLLSVTCAALLAACGDFLTGDRLTTNPNAPTNATATQLLVAAQASLFTQQEGQLARIAGMFTQQIAGTNNQQRDYGSFYTITEGNVAAFWNPNYTGGGLVDLRRIQSLARDAGDRKLEGVAKVIEAIRIGTVADVWGDIPYSEAASAEVRTPKLDPQEAVYAALQVLLDDAITLLGGAGDGPGAADLIYAGNMPRWIRAAYTLKARYHLHTADRVLNAYQAALAAAQNGINEPPATVDDAMHGRAPGDFRSFHGSTVNDGNLWSQFLSNRQDLTAAQPFIDLLQRRADPRLAAYFDPAGDGQYRGATPFGVVPPQGASVVDAATRRQLPFRQPLITWTETQLIIAEASAALGTGTPLANVNAVRTAVGLPALAGPVTRTQIMEEKYVAMYQTIEVWNDYKRTCVPSIVPAGPGGTSAAEVPGRLVYPVVERNANPNVPPPSGQPVRNWNDVAACPRP